MGEMEANINAHFNEELNRIQNDLHEKDRMIEDDLNQRTTDLQTNFDAKYVYWISENIKFWASYKIRIIGSLQILSLLINFLIYYIVPFFQNG